MGIHPTLSVWPPGKEPLPPKLRKSVGRPPELRQRSPNHQLVLAKEIAAGLGPKDRQTILWWNGTRQKLHSRFAALRVRPANRDYWRSEPLPEQWLLIEWPEEEAQPTRYWLGSLAAQRWIIERDYGELKQELGLGQYEGPLNIGIAPLTASVDSNYANGASQNTPGKVRCGRRMPTTPHQTENVIHCRLAQAAGLRKRSKRSAASREALRNNAVENELAWTEPLYTAGFGRFNGLRHGNNCYSDTPDRRDLR